MCHPRAPADHDDVADDWIDVDDNGGDGLLHMMTTMVWMIMGGDDDDDGDYGEWW